ncbi:hypothetical protein KCTCHS21_49660 [Cohnella abietis]|uniref:Uncharacterized protein n=1 Tax=Cohnella abietis TaxID=2507935 RepID=A0A3T1DBU8_9BACL|nr:hypothetical protein KCTCHS21_49660 [Cohnella abietis]
MQQFCNIASVIMEWLLNRNGGCRAWLLYNHGNVNGEHWQKRNGEDHTGLEEERRSGEEDAD